MKKATIPYPHKAISNLSDRTPNHEVLLHFKTLCACIPARHLVPVRSCNLYGVQAGLLDRMWASEMPKFALGDGDVRLLGRGGPSMDSANHVLPCVIDEDVGQACK